MAVYEIGETSEVLVDQLADFEAAQLQIASARTIIFTIIDKTRKGIKELQDFEDVSDLLSEIDDIEQLIYDGEIAKAVMKFKELSNDIYFVVEGE